MGRKNINMGDSRLSHLRFADDMVSITNDISELNEMKNYSKTRVTSSDDTNIYIGNNHIEHADECVYLSYIIQIGKANRHADITRKH